MLWDETAFQDLIIFFRYEPVMHVDSIFIHCFYGPSNFVSKYFQNAPQFVQTLPWSRQPREVQAPLSNFWKHPMGVVKLSFFIVQIGSFSHFNDFYRGFLLVYLEFSGFRRQNVEFQDFAGRITANSSTPPYCCSDSNSVKLLYFSSDIRRNVPIGEEQGETAVFAG